MTQSNVNVLLDNIIKDISDKGDLYSQQDLTENADRIIQLLERIRVSQTQNGLIDLAATLNEKGVTAEKIPGVWNKIAMKAIEQKDYMHISQFYLMMYYLSEGKVTDKEVWDRLREMVENQANMRELDLENQIRVRNIMLRQFPEDLRLQTQLEYFGQNMLKKYAIYPVQKLATDDSEILAYNRLYSNGKKRTLKETLARKTIEKGPSLENVKRLFRKL